MLNAVVRRNLLFRCRGGRGGLVGRDPRAVGFLSQHHVVRFVRFAKFLFGVRKREKSQWMEGGMM